MELQKQDVIYQEPLDLPCEETVLDHTKELLLATFHELLPKDEKQADRIQKNLQILAKLPTDILQKCIQSPSDYHILATTRNLNYAISLCILLEMEEGELITQLVKQLDGHD